VTKELKQYGGGLENKPQILALNKGDLLDDELMESIAADLHAAGAEDVLPLSGATGDGMETVLDKVLEAVGANSSIDKKDQQVSHPVSQAGEAPETKDWSPI